MIYRWIHLQKLSQLKVNNDPQKNTLTSAIIDKITKLTK